MNRFAVPLAVLILAVSLSCGRKDPSDESLALIERTPQIDPDYRFVTVPPNIAPLNFRLVEEGGCRVRIRTGNMEMQLSARKGEFRFPLRRWRKLLDAAHDSLTVTVFSYRNGRLHRYRDIAVYIAPDSVDEVMVYRLIHPAHLLWREMGIYQRRLGDFIQKVILHNRMIGGQCLNCHQFCNGHPYEMMLHLRGGEAGGTLLVHHGRLAKVNTATPFNRAGAYPAWSPDASLIAFSVNALEMFFHSVGEPRDVLDRGSDIVLYDVEKNVLTTAPALSDPARMETFPAWAPDGKTLYFCSSTAFDDFISADTFRWQAVRYDLLKVTLDENGCSDAETVLKAAEVDRSITEPAVSPDGNYLLCCMADNGHFPIYRRESDIYLVDLRTRRYEKLPVNSDESDTFPSWSSNGRWILFSSKRRDGIFSHPYLCYFDRHGKACKPFLLPQKSPAFYDDFPMTFNRPMFAQKEIAFSPQKLAKTAYDNRKRISVQPADELKRLKNDKADKSRQAPN